MLRVIRTPWTLAIALLLALPTLADGRQQRQGQPDPDSPRYKGVVALEAFLQTEGDDAVRHFIETRVAASVRESMGDDALAETLAAMRVEAAGAEMAGGRPIGELAAELVLNSSGREIGISFELDPSDTDRFVRIASPDHSIG